MEICRTSIRRKVVIRENSECVESEVGKAKNRPKVGLCMNPASISNQNIGIATESEP